MLDTKKGLILFLLLGAAVISYLIGFMVGVGVFVMIGLLFETGFWLKWFHYTSNEKNKWTHIIE